MQLFNHFGVVMKILKYVGVFFLFLFVIGFVRGCSNPNHDHDRTPEPQVVKKDIDPESVALSGVYGKTMETLRDPGSFQLISVGTMKDNNKLVACLDFRAKNGFGGLNHGQSVWVFTGDQNKLIDLAEERQVSSADVKQIVKSSQFGVDKPALWNKWCSGQKMNDKTLLLSDVIRASARFRH